MGTTADPTLTSPSRGRRISRRLVLGAALTGGAGVAAVRALGLDRAIHPTGVTSSSGKLDWISPLANEQAKVTHLLRRTTFGASGSQLEAAQAAGFSKTIDQILETPTAQPPPFPSADTASRSTPLNLAKLQQWWVSHILTTPTPFAERMTLFWHGHFTSDYRKVGLQDPFIYWQNLTWRDMALTDFGSILMRVTIDPAMLRYLDLATSTGASPNENFSRELMELFTLGVGNYTEDDVRAAAKGLAGWREPNPAGVIKGQFNSTFPAPHNYKPPVADSAKTGIYVPSRAYKGGPITFLGKNGSFNTQA
ncbi:MAG TPA: DUF1800 family protein, partial [Candidatus Dormibacteraeota bacterium]|nr:DUF1800 family protein [Candidatus Dormibacteraeota bacterium]